MYSDNEIQEYGRSLYQRRGLGFQIERVIKSFHDWRPEKKKCHENVLKFCAWENGCKPIRGWLYLDYGNDNEVSMALSLTRPFVEFLAHSIVQLNDGNFCDITPVEDLAGNYPFIIAVESEEKFVSHIATSHIQKLRYELSTAAISINSLTF